MSGLDEGKAGKEGGTTSGLALNMCCRLLLLINQEGLIGEVKDPRTLVTAGLGTVGWEGRLALSHPLGGTC